jgi:hypothetical protein
LHWGYWFRNLTKGWSKVKKIFGLMLAVLVGAALVAAPMGCGGDKKADPKKTDTPAKADDTKKDETKK